MAFVVALKDGGVAKYYAGRINHYSVEAVAVPSNTDDISLAKKYKYRAGAEKAVQIIVTKSSYVRKCEIIEI